MALEGGLISEGRAYHIQNVAEPWDETQDILHFFLVCVRSLQLGLARHDMHLLFEI